MLAYRLKTLFHFKHDKIGNNIQLTQFDFIFIMSYTDIIKALLEHQYPEPERTDTIIISNIVLRILPRPAVPLFMQYQHLQTLLIKKCDLRNLQNFPKLVSLKHLDISENSLHGTLNYLMPLCSLNYLNLANNLIEDYKKLWPLQTIERLQIYVAGNPFVDGQSWKEEVRKIDLKVIKQPRKLQLHGIKCQQQEIVQQIKVKIQDSIPIQEPNPIINVSNVRTIRGQRRRVNIHNRNPQHYQWDYPQRPVYSDSQLESSSQQVDQRQQAHQNAQQEEDNNLYDEEQLEQLEQQDQEQQEQQDQEQQEQEDQEQEQQQEDLNDDEDQQSGEQQSSQSDAENEGWFNQQNLFPMDENDDIEYDEESFYDT